MNTSGHINPKLLLILSKKKRRQMTALFS